MQVRISTITGASDIDGGIAFLRDQVLPQLRQQKGFRGLSAAGDRTAGVVTVLSVWDSKADLDASESIADKARSDATRIIGGQVSIERFEQSLWEIGETPPGPGAKLHIRQITMDPTRIDDNLAFFRENVLPDIKATPGFLGVRHLIDRKSGEGRVGTLWADTESLKGALAKSEQRRALASERRVDFGEDQVLEVIFASV
jgi:heme-degrading monooxygenase HmoA